MLGRYVIDSFTGFTGLATGACQYLTGCNQYYVLPRAKDGKYPDGQWIDEARLIVADPDTAPVSVPGTGADFAPPSGY